jgi:hypothetical protein
VTAACAAVGGLQQRRPNTASTTSNDAPSTLTIICRALRPRAHIHNPDNPSNSMPMAKLSASSVQASPPPTVLCNRLNAAIHVCRLCLTSTVSAPGAYCSAHESRASPPDTFHCSGESSGAPRGGPLRIDCTSSFWLCCNHNDNASAELRACAGTCSTTRPVSMLSPWGQGWSPERWFIISPVNPYNTAASAPHAPIHTCSWRIQRWVVLRRAVAGRAEPSITGTSARSARACAARQA